MKKSVLVLGSTGLIGHQVYNYLYKSSDYEMFNIAYRKNLNSETIILDARNESEFLKKIEVLQPDIIINCIGILIDGANTDPENAIFLNSYMPHRLKKLSDNIGSKLIHISTDCVFSGKKGQYIESDEKDGESTYAKTKGLGEIVDNVHLTLRTSVVGPELKENGEELFHWFMTQKNEIYGYTQAIWSGVTTLELAKAVKWAIDTEQTGLYHITNNKCINKFDLLSLFKRETMKNITITKTPGRKTDKSFLDTRKKMNYIIPSYEVMIKEMVQEITKNKELYRQYMTLAKPNNEH